MIPPSNNLNPWRSILKTIRATTLWGGLIAAFLLSIHPVLGADWKVLPGHVPKIISTLTAAGLLPATNQLQLAIGLPLRDAAGLNDFLAQVYDPASPNYHQFLGPEEFTARFGPTAADYAAVKNFALTNGLSITGEHGNRLLLDVSGPAAAVEKALHITLRTYRHPSENRNFFAPDTEPSVAEPLPIADVSGLSDYSLPHPKLHRMTVTAKTAPKSGSGSGGSYMGTDFRTAYVPGTALTGTGQTLGVFEFDGFYQSDVTAYETLAGLPNIPVKAVLINGVSGTPGFSGIKGANEEASLDIELPLGMAPGLTKILVFEGVQQNDILNAMAASNQVKQLSCSWGWSGGPVTTTDTIFKQIAAQGQSFFNASGDADAFTVGATTANGVDNPSHDNAPSSNPYITQVGGTVLTTGPGSVWSSETVWNDGDGMGSGGGVSSYYGIPSWQTNTSMAANGGSISKRNIPDVAMVADDIFATYGNGQSAFFEGTSCSAPLWAAFTALVNQQLTAVGSPSIGFINPSIYALGNSPAYASDFNDITTGDNKSTGSPSQYLATSGYDLCTGWGTPQGTNLINALASTTKGMGVSPANGFSAAGVKGGPFSPASQTYLLTNGNSAKISWKVGKIPAWLLVTPSSGTLAAFAQTNVTLSFNTAADNLAIGNYTTNLWFSNITAQVNQIRPASLQVRSAMQVSPTNGFSATGPFGGPFLLNQSLLNVSNIGAVDLTWSLINTSAWLNVFPTNGIIAAAGPPAAVTVALLPATSNLTAKAYSATLRFTNSTTHTFQLIPATLAIGQNSLLNGGFETGNFSGWTFIGDTTNSGLLYNAVVSSTFTNSEGSHFSHSGNYGAALGQFGFLATLSQSVPTLPGQSYLLSFWLRNPLSVPTEQFQVNWNNQLLYNAVNPPVLAWTNLTFIVYATDPNTLLQFAEENDHNYFGLDDVSVTPIPAIAFKSMILATNTYKFSWGATTGLVYQVQYKTNLLQTNWINLGNALTAGTNTLMVADTNALILSPQRFYRLGVTP